MSLLFPSNRHSALKRQQYRLICSFPGDLAANGHRVKVHDTNVDALNSIYKRVEEDRKSMFDEGLIAQNTFPVRKNAFENSLGS